MMRERRLKSFGQVSSSAATVWSEADRQPVIYISRQCRKQRVSPSFSNKKLYSWSAATAKPRAGADGSETYVSTYLGRRVRMLCPEILWREDDDMEIDRSDIIAE
jgi:hypothetical protein